MVRPGELQSSTLPLPEGAHLQLNGGAFGLAESCSENQNALPYALSRPPFLALRTGRKSKKACPPMQAVILALYPLTGQCCW